ncbi:MAG: GFA family protein [Pseudomonadota bacterium]
MDKVTGSCLCGRVVYEVEGEYDSFVLCNCKRCQKGTGSSRAANIFFKEEKIKWVSGFDKISTYHHPNSLHRKTFCSVCGSGLPTSLENFGVVFVPAGSIDSPISYSPSKELFADQRPEWVS